MKFFIIECRSGKRQKKWINDEKYVNEKVLKFMRNFKNKKN